MSKIKTTNGDAYIAFLDVLGFTALVENNSHEQLLRIYDKALLGGIKWGLSNQNNVVYGGPEGNILTNDTTAVPVNSLIVSDSVIIWTEDDSIRSFMNVVSVVRGVMAHSCFEGLPLRGAISIGPISWFESEPRPATHNFQSSVFGVGLTRANQLEKEQEWSGCVVDYQAMSRFEKQLNNSDPSGPAVASTKQKIGILEYTVPMKNGCERMNVLDWVNHPETQARTETVAQAFSRHRKVAPACSLEARISTNKKLINTLRFVRHVFPDADKEGLVAVFAAFNR